MAKNFMFAIPTTLLFAIVDSFVPMKDIHDGFLRMKLENNRLKRFVQKERDVVIGLENVQLHKSLTNMTKVKNVAMEN